MNSIACIETSVTFQAEAFLAQCDLSSETRRTYKSALKGFSSWLTGRTPTGTARETIIAFKRERLAVVSASTCSKDIAALRAYCAWALAEGHIPSDPTAGIKSPKVSKDFKRSALSREEAVRLVEMQAGGHLRDIAILAIMLRGGLRDCEVTRADVGHLRVLNGQQILMVHGKNRASADEWIVVNQKAGEALGAYLSTRGALHASDPIFVSLDGRGHGRLTTRQVRRVITAALEKANLKSAVVTAHSLRHSAATLALEAGVSIADVAAMLRHADIKTAMIYCHMRNRTSSGAEFSLSF